MLTTVDLFSGIGGFARGLEATGHFRTTCFVEQNPFCQAVLKHYWPDVPILDDVRHARQFDFPDSRPDLVCGGFPCQPFSQAGRQLAQDDPRHLWPEMLRIIRELRPTWVCGENVTGLIRLGLDEVLTDLEGEGYATRTFNIPACAVGAPHLRQRIWVVAHADSESEPDGTFDGNARQRQLGFEFGGSEAAPHDSDPDDHGSYRATEYEPDAQHGETQLRDKQVRKLGSVGQDVADSDSQRGDRAAGKQGAAGRKITSRNHPDVADSSSSGLQEHGHSKSEDVVQRSETVPDSGHTDRRRGTKRRQSRNGDFGLHGEEWPANRPEEWWEFEPDVGRLVDGLPNRVSQLRALGNSIVPQIAQEIGQAIRIAHDA